MKSETKKTENQVNPIDQKSDEEKMQEIIRKYSHQTKTYEKTNWWDWDRD